MVSEKHTYCTWKFSGYRVFGWLMLASLLILYLSSIILKKNKVKEVIFKSHDIAKDKYIAQKYSTLLGKTHNIYTAKRCTSVNSLAFIKTAKTGGSTVAGIFCRYALKNKIPLIIAAGVHKYRKLHLKKMIFSDHTTRTRADFEKFMPHDTKYITILRQPLKQILSRIKFLNLSRKYMEDPIAGLKELSKLSNNTMFYARRLHVDRNLRGNALISKISQLQKELDLVLITEYMDLSLLLLRRKLCWDIGDMVYLHLKKADYTKDAINHQDAGKSSGVEAVWTAESDKKFKQVYPVAYKMFNIFNKTLWKRINNAGRDLQEELIFYQHIKNDINEYCQRHLTIPLTQETINNNRLNILRFPESKWGPDFNVTIIDCAIFKLHWRSYYNASDFKPLPQCNGSSIVMEMRRVQKTDYCGYLDPKYGYPLNVLKNIEPYDLYPLPFFDELTRKLNASCQKPLNEQFCQMMFNYKPPS